MAYRFGQSFLLKEIGAAIREKRVAKGWSQEELAFNCGLHRTYVGAVERGERNLSLLSLEKIADALGLSIGALFANVKKEGHNGKKRVPSTR